MPDARSRAAAGTCRKQTPQVVSGFDVTVWFSNTSLLFLKIVRSVCSLYIFEALKSPVLLKPFKYIFFGQASVHSASSRIL